MISKDENPYFLNDFLDYSSTILNKSANTIKEYNYDIAHFLKFIQYEFGIAKLKNEQTIKDISIRIAYFPVKFKYKTKFIFTSILFCTKIKIKI